MRKRKWSDMSVRKREIKEARLERSQLRRGLTAYLTKVVQLSDGSTKVYVYDWDEKNPQPIDKDC